MFYVLFQGKVRIRKFLVRALRLGQTRGPSAADTCLNEHKNSSNEAINSLNEILPACRTF